MEYLKELLVVIMRGLSGAGKTTLRRRLENILFSEHGVDSFSCSADDYFMQDGEYKFAPQHLSDAHASCFKKFLDCLAHAKSNIQPECIGHVIFVDNTNTKLSEITPYYLGAQAHDIMPVLLHIVTPKHTCIEQNEHNVPALTIEAQAARFEEPMPYHTQLTVARDVNIDNLAKTLVDFVINKD